MYLMMHHVCVCVCGGPVCGAGGEEAEERTAAAAAETREPDERPAAARRRQHQGDAATPGTAQSFIYTPPYPHTLTPLQTVNHKKLCACHVCCICCCIFLVCYF